jgi:hypothetical protein
MTTITIYNLIVYCKDASNTIHTHNIWQEQPGVASCPSEISDHTVIESEVANKVSSTSQTIIDDTSGTNGTYRARGFMYPVAAGPDTDYNVIGEFVAPYNMRLASMTITPSTENIGDSFTFVANRNTPIGGITSGVSSGKVLSVTDSVLVHIKVGFEVLLLTGSTLQSLGECLEIDITNKTITVENNVGSAFPPGSLVLLAVKRLETIPIVSEHPLTYGADTIGSSLASKGSIGTMLYKNSTGVTKKLAFYVQFLY